MARYYVGIDVGGTFTDGVVVDQDAIVHIFKTPTVPQNPSDGFINCLRLAAEQFGCSLSQFLSQVEKMTYGTTIATNLLVEGRGAKTGLITTKGFRDTLPVARVAREYLDIDLQFERFPSLTPRHLIEEVSERVDYAGQVVTPLNIEDVTRAANSLLDRGIEAIAICLLWSFKNPAHEKAIRDLLVQRYPGLYISISSEIAPLIGEYERTATVVMNASLGPPIKRHVSKLEADLAENSLKVPLLIMQSTGGVVPAEDASLRPVALMGSGPAGGLIAAKHLAELQGLRNVICADMGGTSFDVSLLHDGQYSASLVTRAYNHNIYVPSIDIYSVGAGGGSIAWLDMGTRLKVGPKSAGADPGPVCYGRGGTQPTVTDADLVLGFLDPEYFAGGQMEVDVHKARDVIRESLAEPLGMDVLQVAAGIRRIVDANMADALSAITLQKGLDPRDYVMMAFGGAGPTHATSMARELGIGTVVVTPMATVQSAFGIVTSDIVHSFSISDVMRLDNSDAKRLEIADRISARYEEMEGRGYQLLERENVRDAQTIRYADLRYGGQAHEVTIQIPSHRLTGADLERMATNFEAKYESLYGRGSAWPEAGLEVVSLRVDVLGRTPKPELKREVGIAGDVSSALKGTRAVFFNEGPNEGDGFVDTTVYYGEKLPCGCRFPGPAVVQYTGTTATILPGQLARVDEYRNLIITETERTTEETEANHDAR